MNRADELIAELTRLTSIATDGARCDAEWEAWTRELLGMHRAPPRAPAFVEGSVTCCGWATSVEREIVPRGFPNAEEAYIFVLEDLIAALRKHVDEHHVNDAVPAYVPTLGARAAIEDDARGRERGGR